MAHTRLNSLAIPDGTVSTNDIANNSITAANIASNAISTDKLAEGAVTLSKINDNASVATTGKAIAMSIVFGE